MKSPLNNHFKNSRYLKKKILLNSILQSSNLCGFFQIHFVSSDTFLKFKKLLLTLNLQISFYKKDQTYLTSFNKLSKDSTFLVYSSRNFELQFLNKIFFDFLTEYQFTLIPLCFLFHKRFMFLEHLIYFKEICFNNKVYIRLFFLLKFSTFRLIDVISYGK